MVYVNLCISLNTQMRGNKLNYFWVCKHARYTHSHARIARIARMGYILLSFIICLDPGPGHCVTIRTNSQRGNWILFNWLLLGEDLCTAINRGNEWNVFAPEQRQRRIPSIPDVERCLLPTSSGTASQTDVAMRPQTAQRTNRKQPN